MLQAVEQPRLALDRLAKVVIHAKRLFDGDHAVKSLVSGDINGAHSALTDLFIDPIAILQCLSGLDHQNCLRL